MFEVLDVFIYQASELWKDRGAVIMAVRRPG